MSETDPAAVGRAGEKALPEGWAFEARRPIRFSLPTTKRPWNWLELDKEEAATLWRILGEFVEFLNRRYVERAELRVPPCWAEHGPLVEELTTLFWARWHAFESREGSVGGAQFFHSYTLPMFLERMGRLIGQDRLRKCQAGRHEMRPLDDPVELASSELRRFEIADADIALRREPRRKAPVSPETASEVASGQGLTEPDVDEPATGAEGDGAEGGGLGLVEGDQES